MKYQKIYSGKWENDKRAGGLKKEVDRTGIDKEGSLEWLRRSQISWDGECVIINAHDQGHYTHAFKKMVGLRQLGKCRFCGEETQSTSHLLLGCK